MDFDEDIEMAILQSRLQIQAAKASIVSMRTAMDECRRVIARSTELLQRVSGLNGSLIPAPPKKLQAL